MNNIIYKLLLVEDIDFEKSIQLIDTYLFEIIAEPVITLSLMFDWWLTADSNLIKLAVRLLTGYVNDVDISVIFLSHYIWLFDVIMLILFIIILLTVASLFNRNLTHISIIILLLNMLINISLTVKTIDKHIYLISDSLHISSFNTKYYMFILILALIYYIYIKTYDSYFTFSSSIVILFILLSINLLLIGNDLVFIYLALELQAFGLYTFAALNRNSKNILEGALKYFLISAFYSSLFILGIGIIYNIYATTNINYIQTLMLFSNELENKEPLLIAGILFIIIAIIGKLGLVPFHFQFIDIYTSLTSKLALFFIIFPKFSLLFLLGRLYYLFLPNYPTINILLFIILILTLIVGGILTLMQSYFMRFIAYSIIFNNAFLFAALFVANLFAFWSIVLFIIFYFITLATIFMITYNIKTLKQLILIENNILSFILVISFFNLAGIPPLSLFFAKFFIILNLLNNGYFYISLILILATVFAAYYYIRIAKLVYYSNTYYIYAPENKQIYVQEFKYIGPNNYTKLYSLLIATLFWLQLIFLFFPKFIYLLLLSLFY
jgi:NADH-quinone oxidoreductase subunit N